MTLQLDDIAIPKLEHSPVVHIVDDDEVFGRSLASLLQSVGIDALRYPDAATFLDEFDENEPAVVVLESRMRGLSGLQLQEHLARHGYPAPVVFCSAHADIATTVRAMRAGAVDFFEKPYDPQVILEAVQQQIVEAERAFSSRADRLALGARIQGLTPREREVLRFVMEGHASQQIATRLGASVKTIDVHRARIRAKTSSSSLGCLIRDLHLHSVTV
jgi:two-component system, LuxR family, response regulator FixJ